MTDNTTRSNSEELFAKALKAEQGGNNIVADKYLKLACKREGEEREAAKSA